MLRNDVIHIRFDQDIRVGKNSRLSTLMQLFFSFDQDMRVEKTLIQTPC